MKKLSRIIISIFALSMMLLLCGTVWADGLKLTLVSDTDSLCAGNTFKVELRFSASVVGMTYTFDYDRDVLELLEVAAYGGVSDASADTQDRYSWMASDLKERTTPVYAVFKVRSANTSDVISVGVKDVKVSSAPDFETVIPTVTPFSKTVLSNETGLEDIKVTAYRSPEDRMNSDNGTEYVIYPENGTVSLDFISYRTPYFAIEATAVDPAAKIRCSATEGFLGKDGVTLTVTVTAPSGDSAKYSVILKALSCIHEFGQVAGSYVAPTCQKAGSVKEKCSFCKTEKTKVIQKLTHSYVQSVVASTCCEGGYTKNVCTVCAYEEISDETAPLEHSLVAQSTTSTCNAVGQTVYGCSVCGAEIIMQDTAYGEHKYVSELIKPTCMERGKTVHTCEVCNESYEDSYTDAAGHSYKSTITEPTCSESGYTTFTCEACGDTYVDNYIGATGHRYGEWIIQIVPTTENEGSARRTCASCGGSEIQVLPRLVQGSDGINDNSETAKEPLFLVIILQIGIIALLILFFIMYLMFKKKTNMRDK